MTARDDDGDDEPAHDFERRTAPADRGHVPAAATVAARPGATPKTADHVHVDETSAFDPPADRFAERRELGRGGMGRVVEAYDVALGRAVAVKHMLSDGVTDLARFEREARITARLEHPGIVPIHDAGRTPEGTPYYVMRRVDGEPLEREVTRRTTYAERVSLVPNVLAACDAVGFAHARGVIHRDLKPANILIGPFGETLVIDWGIARTVDEADDPDRDRTSGAALTRIGSVAGTPGFMAPEQARGEPLDARADVYALGATLFFVLASATPYASGSATEMIDRAGADKPPEWSRLPAETPPELRAILEKAMAPRREGRYVDGTALAVDLRHYVSGQLVGAYEYSAWEQLKRFVRRHRAAVAIATLAAIVIAIGSTILVRRIIAERDTANSARDRAELARRDADDRSDQLLVQGAQQLATTNPPAAIARLRALDPSSRQWRRAWVAASAANARGITFGFANAPRGRLRTSPDSRYVLVTGYPQWQVEVFDLHRRERVVIPEPAPSVRVDMVEWIDSEHFLVVSTSTAYIIALAGGARALPISTKTTWVSAPDGGRLWLVDDKRRAHLIDRDTTNVDAIVIEDVDRADPIGMDRTVLRRGTTLSVMSAGATTPFAEGIVSHVVAHGRVATKTAEGQMCSWAIEATPVQQHCVQEDPTASLIAPRENGLVSHRIAPEGSIVNIWLKKDPKPRMIRDRMARSSARGALVDTEDEILTIDMTQTYVVQHNFGDTNYIDQTADGRFLVALTGARELVVWDLPAFRGVEIGTGMAYQLVGAFESSVWRIEHFERLLRRDNATGEEVEILKAPNSNLLVAEIDPTETWIAAGTETETRAVMWTLRHRPTNTSAVQPTGSLFNFDAGRAYRVEANGTISELTPAPVTLTKVDVGGSAIEIIVVRGEWLVTGNAKGRLCRVHLPTRASNCATFDTLTAANLANTGVVYVAIDRRVHTWGLDDARTPIAPDARVDALQWTGSRMVGTSVDGVVVLDDTLRSVATPKLGAIHVLDDERIAATTFEDGLIVIDLIAGSWFRVAGASPTIRVFGIGKTIVFNSGPWYKVDLAVPTEPTALRAWLDSVTNARVVGVSDVVQWP